MAKLRIARVTAVVSEEYPRRQKRTTSSGPRVVGATEGRGWTENSAVYSGRARAHPFPTNRNRRAYRCRMGIPPPPPGPALHTVPPTVYRSRGDPARPIARRPRTRPLNLIIGSLYSYGPARTYTRRFTLGSPVFIRRPTEARTGRYNSTRARLRISINLYIYIYNNVVSDGRHNRRAVSLFVSDRYILTRPSVRPRAVRVCMCVRELRPESTSERVVRYEKRNRSGVRVTLTRDINRLCARPSSAAVFRSFARTFLRFSVSAAAAPHE